MALKSLSTTDLMRELERRQRGADRLLNKREKVLAELASIDGELSALGISGGKRTSTPGAAGAHRPSTGKRRRAKNAMSLPDALVQACEVGAIVSPAEASELVMANGFKTTSSRFNMMVSNALAKDGRFKRIGRGQYERTV